MSDWEERHKDFTPQDWAIEGLLVDGAHHKQWYLERVIEALGCDLPAIRAQLLSEDYEAEPGIAP